MFNVIRFIADSIAGFVAWVILSCFSIVELILSAGESKKRKVV
jgi:hypothetical protein